MILAVEQILLGIRASHTCVFDEASDEEILNEVKQTTKCVLFIYVCFQAFSSFVWFVFVFGVRKKKSNASLNWSNI